MGGVAPAVEQGHHQLARPIRQGLAQALLQRPIQQQGTHLATIGPQPSLHLHHAHIEGLGALNAEGKEIGPVLVANAQQIGQAAGEQQQHGLAGVFQQGVGGHGGAEPHLLHQPRWKTLSRHSQHLPHRPDGRIPGPLWLKGEHLAHLEGACRRAGHHIGECAAAINPKPPTPGRRGLGRSLGLGHGARRQR